MAYNGSGVFQRLYSWVTDAAAGVPIRADKMDAEMDGFATGLSNCITRDGQGKPSAAIDWNGQDLTGVADLAAGTIAVSDTTAPSGNGLYKPRASVLGMVAGSVEYATLGSSGLSIGTGEQSASTGDGVIRAPTAIGTNLTGASLYLKGGIGTGSGLGGSIIFQTAPAGSAGTTQGTPATALTIDSTKKATFAGAVEITGASTLTGAASLASTLAVTGATTLTGAASLASTLAVTGDVAVNTNKFNVTASSGNTTIAGTLAVTGILSAAATESKAANGYVKLYSGVYLQWGTATISASGSTSGTQTVSYPTAFPTAVLQVLICGQTPSTPVAGAAFSASSAGTSNFTLGWAVVSAGNMGGGTVVTYLAIGY